MSSVQMQYNFQTAPESDLGLFEQVEVRNNLVWPIQAAKQKSHAYL